MSVPHQSAQRVVLINTKGGSGKTTLATNLAAYYAHCGKKTALTDYDSQGSATYWLSKRGGDLPSIQSIPAYKYNQRVTRSWFLRAEPDTQKIVVDTPAGLAVSAFTQVLDKASAIIVPVPPSDIDIHAASHCIADLLLVAKYHQKRDSIAVVANRVRKNLSVYRKLERFLQSLGIPFVTTLRDTTYYVQAADQGMGVHELNQNRVQADIASWQPLIDWLEDKGQTSQIMDRNGIRG